MYACRRHNLRIGNSRFPGQSKGAMIRHLMGLRRLGGHEMSLEDAREEVDSYLE